MAQVSAEEFVMEQPDATIDFTPPVAEGDDMAAGAAAGITAGLLGIGATDAAGETATTEEAEEEKPKKEKGPSLFARLAEASPYTVMLGTALAGARDRLPLPAGRVESLRLRHQGEIGQADGAAGPYRESCRQRQPSGLSLTAPAQPALSHRSSRRVLPRRSVGGAGGGLRKTRWIEPELVLVDRTGFVPLLCSFFGLSSEKETRMLASKDVDQYTTPRKKLLRFFVGSRDDWKTKCGNAKKERKLQANQVRAVEKSREHWRTLAEERQRAHCRVGSGTGGTKKRRRLSPPRRRRLPPSCCRRHGSSMARARSAGSCNSCSRERPVCGPPVACWNCSAAGCPASSGRRPRIRDKSGCCGWECTNSRAPKSKRPIGSGWWTIRCRSAR